MRDTQPDNLPTIDLSGCMTEADLLHAYRLAGQPWRYRLWLSIGVIAVFILVFIAVAVSTRPYSQEASNRILFAVCIFLPAILLVPYIRSRVALRRLLGAHPDALHPYETTIDADGVRMKADASESRIAWDAFTKFRASDTMCLLYWKEGPNYAMISKSRFPDLESWDAFLNFVKSRFVAA